MNPSLFKVIVDVNLVEKKQFLTPSGGSEFSNAYFQFFGVVAVSEERARQLAKLEIADGTVAETKIIPWLVEDFRREFPTIVFDLKLERIVYRSGRAFN